MRNAALALLVVIAIGGCVHTGEAEDFITLDLKPEGYAWWLRARFHPSETQVRGIPVREISKNWCKASEFRREMFPRELDFNDDLSFAIDGFFDGSKIKQTAVVGAYETCDGTRGSFLLILNSPRQGPPTIRFVHEMPTDHQFGILRAGPNSSIESWHCMSCDSGSRLKWDRSKRRFVWVESDD